MKKNEELCRMKSQRALSFVKVKSLQNYLLFLEKELSKVFNNGSSYDLQEQKKIFGKSMKYFFSNKLPKQGHKYEFFINCNLGFMANIINYFCPEHDMIDLYYQTMLVFDRVLSQVFEERVVLKRMKQEKIVKSFQEIKDNYKGF